MKKRVYKINGYDVKVNYTDYFNTTELSDGISTFFVGITHKRGKHAAEYAYETAVSLGYINPVNF